MNHSIRLLISLFLLLILSQCKEPSVTAPNDTTPTRGDNITLGNQDGANSSESNPNAYLIPRATYSLSYNNSTGIANWCSWHLSLAWKGSTSHYTGFDRGHLCPSYDWDSTAEETR